VVIPMVQAFMITFDVNAADVLVGAALVFSWWFVYQIARRWFNNFTVAYAVLLQYAYGYDLEPVYISTPGRKLPIIKEEKDFTPEAACSADGGFIYKQSNLPEGVFQIFALVDDVNLHVGHGFMVANAAYTARHVVAGHKRLYARRGNSRFIPMSMGDEFPECDLACIVAPGLGAALSLKSLKWGFANKNPLTVLHYETNENVYYRQSIYADAFVPGSDPSLIKTASHTDASDSGLPILQAGVVVAVHIGYSHTENRNVHVIPIPMIANLIETHTTRFVPILKDMGIESPSTGNNEDAERAQALADARENWKRARMRGEHKDDQGFRMRKTDWADLEDANEDPDTIVVNGKRVKIRLESGLSNGLKASSPTCGASTQMPQDSVLDSDQLVAKVCTQSDLPAKAQDELRSLATSLIASATSSKASKRKRSKKSKKVSFPVSASSGALPAPDKLNEIVSSTTSSVPNQLDLKKA